MGSGWQPGLGNLGAVTVHLACSFPVFVTVAAAGPAWVPQSLISRAPPPRVHRETMPSSGHRLRDVEHHPLLTENDSYDSSSSSSSEADVADRVWFIHDGCGMICAVLTWLLVVYADFVVTFVMLLPSKDFWYSVVNGVIFNCLAVLALSSHLRTMLTDPVSPPCRAGLPSGSGLGWHHRPRGGGPLAPVTSGGYDSWVQACGVFTGE